MRRAGAAISASLPMGGNSAFEHVHALAVDPEGRTLLLGAHTGLFRSEDAGQTWQRVELSGSVMGIDFTGWLVVGDQAVSGETNDPGFLMRRAARTYIANKLRKYLHPTYQEAT